METTARQACIPDLQTGAGRLDKDSARRLVLVPTGLPSARVRSLEARRRLDRAYRSFRNYT